MKSVNVNEFKIGVIYMYTSPTGKKYIGQTINESSRKTQHKNKTVKENTKFGRAIKKYGYVNFKYEVLIKFNPTIDKGKLKRVLNKLEERYISLYNSIEEGYNLRAGGESSMQSPETIEKLRNYANNMTAEHKEKLSIAAKKRADLDMQDSTKRDEIIERLKKGWYLSQPTSEETKQKQSEAKNSSKKSICQYNDKMELLNTFKSISEAAKSIENEATHKTRSNRISECISGKWKSAYGFIWIKE